MTNRFMRYCFLGLLLGFMACTESTIDMVYNETQCADHWQTNPGSTITEVEEAVAQYFMDEGIEVSDISITEDGQFEACLACTCTSDRRIHLKVDEEDQKALEDLRFTIE